MNINDMIDAGITIEGEIEIRKWDSEADDSIMLFRDDACELDCDASYMYDEISYMFALNGDYTSVICFELVD